jgi:probable rRNA maturation factor
MPVLASTTGDVGPVDVEGVAVDAQHAVDALGSVDWEVSLLFCDDAFIAPLNGQWRGKGTPTDVLSFPQLEVVEPGHPPIDGGPLLGDVVISVETARRQAAELGHSLDDELRVLLVHGICHLVGHTHDTDEERAAMARLEARLLDAMDRTTRSLVARTTEG